MRERVGNFRSTATVAFDSMQGCDQF